MPGIGSQLPPLSDVERVSTSVIRVLGGNPGKFTLQGTNTYLISPPDSPTRLLLDTGQGAAFPSWRRSIQHVLDSESARLGKRVKVTQCVLSHWHHDHVGGITELQSLSAEGNGEIDEDETQGEKDKKQSKEGEMGLKLYKYPLYDHSPSPTQHPPPSPNRTREGETKLLTSANSGIDIGPLHDLHDGQLLSIGPPSSPQPQLQLRVLHTPGHTADHVALVITSSPADPTEVGTVFTGDAVLGHGTAVFEDLGLYMQSLEKMRDAIRQVGEAQGEAGNVKVKAFPGHGAPIADAAAKIEEYIAHRAMREREVMDVLTAGSSPGADGQVRVGWSPMEIVKVVYRAVPESLHVAAAGGVVQVLCKLEGEGRVERVGSGGERGIEDGEEREVGERGRWRAREDQVQDQKRDRSGEEEQKEAVEGVGLRSTSTL